MDAMIRRALLQLASEHYIMAKTLFGDMATSRSRRPCCVTMEIRRTVISASETMATLSFMRFHFNFHYILQKCGTHSDDQVSTAKLLFSEQPMS